MGNYNAVQWELIEVDPEDTDRLRMYSALKLDIATGVHKDIRVFTYNDVVNATEDCPLAYILANESEQRVLFFSCSKIHTPRGWEWNPPKMYKSSWMGAPDDPGCIFCPACGDFSGHTSFGPFPRGPLPFPQWFSFSFGGSLSLALQYPLRHLKIKPMAGRPYEWKAYLSLPNGDEPFKAVLHECCRIRETNKWANTLFRCFTAPHIATSEWFRAHLTIPNLTIPLLAPSID